LGLPSGGLQTNGFSLARRLLAERYADTLENGTTVGDALLAPHRSFLGGVTPLLDAGLVRGMAHITGGGLPGNLPRVLPDGLGAEVTADWPVPEVFGLIGAAGVGRDEMFQVFNMGVGFVLIAAPEDAADICRRLPEAFTVGKVVPGAGVRVG
jgi:phosphoribosylformylglycinamidine cyclo-ligase